MSGPFKMRGTPFQRNFNKGFNIKKGKKNLKFGDLGTDKYGERDFSEHNIHARKTEGTIAQQDALRKANKKINKYGL